MRKNNQGYGEVTTKLLSDELSVEEKEALFKSRKATRQNFSDLFDALCETAKPKKITAGMIEACVGKNAISRYKAGGRKAKRSTIIEICFALRQEGATVTADDINAMLEIFDKRRLNSYSSADFFVTIAVSESMNLDELTALLYEKGCELSDLDKPEIF
jgi:hypothetical protein